MPCPRFAALTLAVLGGLSALCISRPSAACSPPPDGRYASSVPRAVPLDGVIVAQVRCYSNCPETAPALVVTDKDTGEVLTGTQEEVAGVPVSEGEGLLAFRPAAPLVDGRTYQVTVEQQSINAEIWETQASAAVDMDVGAVPVQASVVVEERWHGETSCCTDDGWTCGPEEMCVAEEVERYVKVFLDVSGGVDHGVGQYVKTFTFSSPDGEELGKKTVWEGFLGESYDVAATEYCYQLTYRSLVDGTTIEKERTCVPHGDAGATGIFPSDAATIADAIEGCAAPPEGFEQAWCSARAATCERHPSECGEDDVSSCEDPGPGAGGDPPEAPEGDHVSVGCSASAGRGASYGWALPAIGLALSLTGRARRRRDRR